MSASTTSCGSGRERSRPTTSAPNGASGLSLRLMALSPASLMAKYAASARGDQSPPGDGGREHDVIARGRHPTRAQRSVARHKDLVQEEPDDPGRCRREGDHPEPAAEPQEDEKSARADRDRGE